MRPSATSRGYLHSLDGWRAIAVAMVLLDHAQSLGGQRMEHYVQGHGPDGVWLFFAISGLLICSRLLEEEQLTGSISLRNFYVRRAFRIFPASWTYLAVLVALWAAGVIPLERGAWASALLFCRNYWSYFTGGGGAGAWFTGHFWSLAVEEHFYLFFPAVMVVFPRMRRLVLSVLGGICVLWMMLYLHGHSMATRSIFWSQRTEFCLIGLLVPAVLAITLTSAGMRDEAKRRLNPTVLVVICLGMLVVQSRVSAEGTMMLGKSLLFPLLLLSTVLHPDAWLTRLLEAAPMRFAGRISYSLYLWQSLFLTRRLVFAGPIHALQSPATGSLCAVACAVASYYAVETPMIRFGRRFVRGSLNVNQATNPIVSAG